MVIDSSAVIAILCDEPEAPELEALIELDSVRLMSVASVLECSIVIEARFGTDGGRELDLLMVHGALDAVPIDVEQLHIARHAFRHYGKGRRSAGLNFGDCFSYALAKATGEPLLCIGNDFPHTDVTCCR